MPVNWLKKGAESAAVAQKEAAVAEQRKSEMGKMWRFWLKDEEEARITFVDGDLCPEGFLLPPRFYEHNVYLNGSWNNFYVCPEMTGGDEGEKCPLCESGDRPSLVALFTVIDHRIFESKDGKKYTNVPKLLAAKAYSFEMLNKLAMKRGGLAGCTFDVSRIGEKAASIGSLFDFVEKTDVETLKAKYTETFKDKDGKNVTVSRFVPANYETEITYRTSQELRQLGFGKPVTSGGAPAGFGSTQQQPQVAQNYAQHL